MELGDVALAFDLAERSRSRAFLDTLFAGQPELLRRQEGETLSLADVQSALTPGALLLAFYTSGAVAAEARGTRQAMTLRHRFPPPRTIVFGVTHDHVEVFDAGLSPNDLLPQRLQAAAERHFLQPAIRRTLYDRLLRPVAHLLAGKHRIYLVPHGPLHYVPFQALIAPDGETLLRPGGPELVYGPSASVLFRQMPPKSPRSDDTRSEISTSTLAFGYNGDGPQRLRFAEDEARAVAGLLGGEALAGPASKREALFRQGADARYLHISCHGEFDPESPLESLLHLGAGETLTAHEVLEGLRLSCELVTLSACESGLSRVRRGDELMGLVRAFMVAGAPCGDRHVVAGGRALDTYSDGKVLSGGRCRRRFCPRPARGPALPAHPQPGRGGAPAGWRCAGWRNGRDGRRSALRRSLLLGAVHLGRRWLAH